MPSPLDSVKKGASVAASVLETTAGVLRGVAGSDTSESSRDEAAPSEQPERKPAADAAKPAEAGTSPDADKSAQTTTPADTAATVKPAGRGAKPAAGTRSRIANPKAAKKVRAREG